VHRAELLATAHGPRVVSEVAAYRADPAILANVAATLGEIGPSGSPALLARDVDFGTLVEKFGAVDPTILQTIRRRLAPVRDTYGAFAHAGGTRVVQLTVPSKRVLALSEGDRAGWTRVAYHLGSAYRLRTRLRRSFEPAAMLDPSGRVHHADASAKAAPVRDALVRAARRIERARGPLRKDDPRAALALWRGLVDGRWSLVDHWESDGRRFLAAYENPPGVVDVRRLAEWQQRILASFLRGATVREVAFRLGYTVQTVERTLSLAARLLRFRGRADLASVGLGELSRAVVSRSPRIELLGVSASVSERAHGVLSTAEREIARLAAAGVGDAEIATRRGVSVRTVSNQLSRVYAKTSTRGRLDLVRWLREER